MSSNPPPVPGGSLRALQPDAAFLAAREARRMAALAPIEPPARPQRSSTVITPLERPRGEQRAQRQGVSDGLFSTLKRKASVEPDRPRRGANNPRGTIANLIPGRREPSAVAEGTTGGGRSVASTYVPAVRLLEVDDHPEVVPMHRACKSAPLLPWQVYLMALREAVFAMQPTHVHDDLYVLEGWAKSKLSRHHWCHLDTKSNRCTCPVAKANTDNGKQDDCVHQALFRHSPASFVRSRETIASLPPTTLVGIQTSWVRLLFSMQSSADSHDLGKRTFVHVDHAGEWRCSSCREQTCGHRDRARKHGCAAKVATEDGVVIAAQDEDMEAEFDALVNERSFIRPKSCVRR